ncbi:hypothetical protein D3C81_1681150 [compost metagenome]
MPYETRATGLRGKAAALLGAQPAQALWDFVEALDTLQAPALYPRLHAWMAASSGSAA